MSNSGPAFDDGTGRTEPPRCASWPEVRDHYRSVTHKSTLHQLGPGGSQLSGNLRSRLVLPTGNEPDGPIALNLFSAREMT